MISIVIPAHNEASAIGMCLDSLLGDPLLPGGAEIIVVCNGCTDGSADVVRLRNVKLLEIPEASKARALEVGDLAAVGFPRFYLDADVLLAPGSIQAMIIAMSNDLDAAAPTLHVDTRQATLPVRMYQSVWSELPEIKNGLAGRGVYAMSEAGHRDFPGFSGIVADDRYVHKLFWPARGRSVPGAESTVRSSQTTRDLISRKRRVYRANRELESTDRAAADVARRPTARRPIRQLIDLAVDQPRLIPAIPLYLAVGWIAGQLSELDRRSGTTSWNQDASSR